MSKRRYKIRLALAVLVAGGGLVAVLATDTSPNLGLDLRGGINVILTAESAEDIQPEVLQKTVEIIRQRIDALGVAEPEVTSSGNNILIQLPGVENEQRALKLIGSTAQLTFRQVEEQIDTSQIPAKKVPEVTEQTGSEINDQEVVYPSAEEPNILYRLKPAELTGDVITDAEPQLDQLSSQWSVALSMSDAGADVWADFTSRLACLRDKNPNDIRAQVGIVLDGKVETATGMATETGQGSGVVCGTGITGGESQITVGSQGEAKDLSLVLRTGALPITLEQNEVSKVSATLGEDSLHAGILAGALGLGLVLIYVVLYYRALGLIVWVGLLIFTATMYTFMSVLGEAAGLSLSLAGIAGIIVSIGITTDSYIVAFERLKDEVKSGKSVRAAVERGMGRAFRTILVADFVTASAAVILFYLAVGSVKGFALTLGLATVVDVLIAYFFTRSAVALLAGTKTLAEGRFIGIKQALGARV